MHSTTAARTAYATNAWNLLQARRHGHRPLGVVHVALADTPPCDAGDVVLHVHPGARPDDDRPLDWRMLVDLPVQVWADRSVPLGQVVECVAAIAQAKPRSLFLRFVDDGHVHDVDVGSGRHLFPAHSTGLPAVHEFVWLPVNTGGTPLGRRLRQALCEAPLGMPALRLAAGVPALRA